MMDCRSVARLLTSGSIDQESALKRLKVKFHLWMCEHCSGLARQLAQIRSAARQMTSSMEPPTSTPGNDLESRISKRLSTRYPT